MPSSCKLRVKFWGVRGSIPTPVACNLGYGGNTTCVEVASAADRVIIDLGSGARSLGTEMFTSPGGLKLDVLMTHFHWDHIQGLPFFGPLYSPAAQVTFHSSLPPVETRAIFEGHMKSPYFPVKFDSMGATRLFAGGSFEPFAVGGFRIVPFAMNHPQGATGYRIEHGGKVYVHASDLEHGDAEFDRLLREHAQGADILAIDAQYTPAEYEAKRGWGHSTYEEATRVAKECGVKQLVLFHHDPGHDDAFLDSIVMKAREAFENTSGAREGQTLEV